MKTERRTDS